VAIWRGLRMRGFPGCGHPSGFFHGERDSWIHSNGDEVPYFPWQTFTPQRETPRKEGPSWDLSMTTSEPPPPRRPGFREPASLSQGPFLGQNPSRFLPLGPFPPNFCKV